MVQWQEFVRIYADETGKDATAAAVVWNRSKTTIKQLTEAEVRARI